MSFSHTVTCSRCNRSENRSVKDPAEILAIAQNQQAKNEVRAKIREFFESLPREHLPAHVTVHGQGSAIVIHDELCTGENAKRSCAKRVGDLTDAINELEERKAPARKAKTTSEAASEDVLEPENT